QLCFTGTESRVQGADFDDLESDMRELAQRAWNPREPIEQGGLLKYVHAGEYHMYNPDVIAALQAAVVTGDDTLYRQYAALVNGGPAPTFPALPPLCSRGPPPPLSAFCSRSGPARRSRWRRWNRWRPCWRALTAPACHS